MASVLGVLLELAKVELNWLEEEALLELLPCSVELEEGMMQTPSTI
jgi:hypothetical protein